MKAIQLTPSCKDYLWGGEKLRTEYGIQSELHPLSEAWMPAESPSYMMSMLSVNLWISLTCSTVREVPQEATTLVIPS